MATHNKRAGVKVKFEDVREGDNIAVYDLIKRPGAKSVDKRLRAQGTVSGFTTVGGARMALDVFGDVLASSMVVGPQKIEKVR